MADSQDPPIANSRLLSRLDSEILSAKSPVDAACFRAERAGVYARLGRVDVARKELDYLTEFNSSRSVLRLSVLISLGRGLLEYYCSHEPAARIWFLRAVALGRASGTNPLLALPLAWLAAMEFERDNLPEAISALQECISIVDAGDLTAKARASMVGATLNSYIGRFPEAIECSRRARQYASSHGDETIHAASMANMAAYRISHLRQAEVFSEIKSDDLEVAKALASSSVNFDRGLDLGPSAYLTDALRAELLARIGDYVGALSLYESSFEETIKLIGSRRESYIVSDMAWCLLCLGESDRSMAMARRAEASLQSVLHLDDRAVVCGQLGKIYRRLGVHSSAEELESLSETALMKLKEERGWLLSRLKELPSF